MSKIVIVLHDYFLSITFVSQLLPDPVSVCLISVIVILAVKTAETLVAYQFEVQQ